MPARTQTPPKRMTRSQAKAVNEVKPQQKAINPITKAAATSTKRRTRADEAQDELNSEDWEDAQVMVPEVHATQHEATVKSRAAPSRATAATVSTSNRSGREVATRGRGRPAKSLSTRQPEMESSQSTEAKPVTRTTRARATLLTVAETDPEEVVATARTATIRKKVTFAANEADKENKEVQPVSKKRGAAEEEGDGRTGGLKAKPVRGTATRGRAAARGGRASRNTPRPLPLSPIKNAQTTVPSQAQEEDEDHVEAVRPPTPQLQKSPIKPASLKSNISPIRQTSAPSPAKVTVSLAFDASVDELQASTTLFCSPAKKLGSSTDTTANILTSPPKGAMTQSPRKPDAGLRSNTIDTTKSTIESSTMFRPAKKFPVSAPAKQPVFNLSDQDPGRNAMLGSPAKRPSSPTKDMRFGSSRKSSATSAFNRSMTASGVRGTPRKLLSPMKASSAFRAARSPAAALRVHRMTDEEQTRMFEDELACAPSPFSPIKASVRSYTPQRKSLIPVRSPPRSTEHARLDILVPTTALEAIERSADTKVMSSTAFASTPFCTARDTIDETSDDELSYDRTEIESPLGAASRFATPKPAAYSDEPMTALAERFGQWQGARPDETVLQQGQAEVSAISSPLATHIFELIEGPRSVGIRDCTTRQSLSFEDAIAIHVDEDESMLDMDDPSTENICFRQSQISDASQEYGDENVMPVDPALLHQVVLQDAAVATCTPAKLINAPMHVHHTVSRVPLKPAADDHPPYQKPARRGHSLAAPLSPQAELNLAMMRQCHPLPSQVNGTRSFLPFEQPGRLSKFAEMLDEDENEDMSNLIDFPATPTVQALSSTAAATPARTPRPGLDIKLLAGAVVYVNVHTSEGADASGIFVELLTQMGARCVKQWTWNSRGSLDGSNSAGDLENKGSPKVGITHVVFKDGGKRTMEKVREAKGLVLCVGVGWVLDCEKENKWLDEAEYAIDTSTIPRGGARRRKSMEPMSIRNSLFSPTKPTAPGLGPTQEFFNLCSATPRRETVQLPLIDDRQVSFTDLSEVGVSSMQSTPTNARAMDAKSEPSTPQQSARFVDGGYDSPTTPYFLHPQQLVQQTCPPKQTQQLFFPLSGRIEDEANESMRQRLTLARRKSLQFAPRTSSPLAQANTYQ